MKNLEYIAIEVLLKLIGGMIFLLRKMRGLTDRLMDDYERRVLKSSKFEFCVCDEEGGVQGAKGTEKGAS